MTFSSPVSSIPIFTFYPIHQSSFRSSLDFSQFLSLKSLRYSFLPPPFPTVFTFTLLLSLSSSRLFLQPLSPPPSFLFPSTFLSFPPFVLIFQHDFSLLSVFTNSFQLSLCNPYFVPRICRVHLFFNRQYIHLFFYLYSS